MADILYLSDRIKETTYTIGTGDFSLVGAAQGFSSFSSAYNNNDLLFYAATNGTAYEVGSGIFNSGISGFSIKRFPFRSSNNNAKISFNEGVKEVYVTYPATHSVHTGSGLSGLNVPQASGLAYWKSSNTLNCDYALVWDDENGYLGINKSNPEYGIDLGGSADSSLIKTSGIIVGSSGIYFPPQNDYLGGRQTTHYEKNRLDQYAYDNTLLGELTGSNAVLALSGVANEYILFKKQNAGFVFAGPPSGCTPPCSPGYPSFRQLTVEDLPELVNVSGILNNKIFTALTNITTASGALNTKIDAVSGVLRTDITTVSGIVSSITTQATSDIVQGRLTLESGVPVSTSDQAGKSIVYYAPLSSTSNKIALYNGSTWQSVSFTQKSITLSALGSSTNYDIFGYLDGGNLVIQLGAAWTNSNTRSENLTLKDGVLCKASDLTKRYLGTIRTTSSSTTEDSSSNRFVWNAHNRVSKRLKADVGNYSWTYSTNSWRPVRNIKSAINLVYGGTDIPEYKENIDLKAGLIYAGDGSITATTTTTTTTTTVGPGTTTTTTTTTLTPSLNNLYSTGQDDYEQLGNGVGNLSRTVYTSISNLNWLQIAAGDYFCAAILNDTNKTLYTWGRNEYGQLSTGNTVTVTVPQLETINCRKVVCGNENLFLIKSDDTLWVVGRNDSWQLGTGNSITLYNLFQPSPGEAWSDISAGQLHTLGIKTDGSLWGWGSSGNYKLNPNTQLNYPQPFDLSPYIPVGAGTPIKIVSGPNHNILLTDTGKVLSWGGSNTYGELGDGTNTNVNRTTYQILQNLPIYSSTVFSSRFFVDAACGTSHTLLLDNTGQLWACGRNQFGQLGIGNNTNSNIFTQIIAVSSFSKIAARGWSSYVILQNGNLYSWGNNSYGQLGLGDTSNRSTATFVTNNVSSVAAGIYHSLIIR